MPALRCISPPPFFRVSGCITCCAALAHRWGCWARICHCDSARTLVWLPWIQAHKCALNLIVCKKFGMAIATVNFAAAVDRTLLKRTKADTSINALFNAELRYLLQTFEAAEASGNQNFRTLLDFSLGWIDDHAAMGALGIDSQEELFLLMAQAHLPAPAGSGNTRHVSIACTRWRPDRRYTMPPGDKPPPFPVHAHSIDTTASYVGEMRKNRHILLMCRWHRHNLHRLARRLLTASCAPKPISTPG